MAVDIALHEAGIPFEAERVDLTTRKTASGEDFLQINPKGYVPALRLDDGSLLTEAGLLLQFVADLKPGAGLAPAPGTMDRYRLMEWLAFLSTEVHKGFGPLWNPKVADDLRKETVARLGKRFDLLAATLAERPFLMGDRFTVADAYLFTLLGWTDVHRIDLTPWPALQAYRGRIGARPAVQATLKDEGLVK